MSTNHNRRDQVMAFLAVHGGADDRVAKNVRALMQRLGLPPVDHGKLTGKLIQMGLRRWVPQQCPPLAFNGDAIWAAACMNCIWNACSEFQLEWSAQRARSAINTLADRTAQTRVARAINLFNYAELNLDEASLVYDKDRVRDLEKVYADFLEVILGAVAMGEGVSMAIKLAQRLIEAHLTEQLFDAVAAAWSNSRDKSRNPMTPRQLIGAHRVQCHYATELVLNGLHTEETYIWGALRRGSNEDDMRPFLERAAQDDGLARRVANIIVNVHGYPLAAAIVHLSARPSGFAVVTHFAHQTTVHIGAKTIVLRPRARNNEILKALQRHT